MNHDLVIHEIMTPGGRHKAKSPKIWAERLGWAQKRFTPELPKWGLTPIRPSMVMEHESYLYRERKYKVKALPSFLSAHASI